MGYNAIDLINKCILIEDKKRKMLETVADRNDISARLGIVIKALLKDVDRVTEYYKNINMELQEDENLTEIEFRTYDKISFLINEYSNKIEILNIEKKSAKDFLKAFFDLTVDKRALFVDIQGRLFNNMKASDKTYKVLTQIISFTSYEIRTIEKTIK